MRDVPSFDTNVDLSSAITQGFGKAPSFEHDDLALTLLWRESHQGRSGVEDVSASLAPALVPRSMLMPIFFSFVARHSVAECRKAIHGRRPTIDCTM